MLKITHICGRFGPQTDAIINA